MTTAPSESTDRAAQGVRRSEAAAMSAVGSARTRTLGGETVEFKAVDYRAPEGARPDDTRPRAVAAAEGTRFGHAAGVSSLRKEPAPVSEGRGVASLGRKGWAAVAAVLATLVVLVFAGGYVLMQGVLTSVNEGGTGELSAGYATDSYTVVAVRGDDGSLASLYLGYVDSIRGRSEFCSLDPKVRYTEDGTEGIRDFADVYGSRGLEGLVNAVASTAAITVPTAFVVDESQASALFSLGEEGEASAVDPAELAAAIAGEGQEISQAALRGLLLTIKQVGPEGFVMLQAPTEEVSTADGGSALALQPQAWLMLVRGLRDAASGEFG